MEMGSREAVERNMRILLERLTAREAMISYLQRQLRDGIFDGHRSASTDYLSMLAETQAQAVDGAARELLAWEGQASLAVARLHKRAHRIRAGINPDGVEQVEERTTPKSGTFTAEFDSTEQAEHLAQAARNFGCRYTYRKEWSDDR